MVGAREKNTTAIYVMSTRWNSIPSIGSNKCRLVVYSDVGSTWSQRSFAKRSWVDGGIDGENDILLWLIASTS
jgi:hypothetical protein